MKLKIKITKDVLFKTMYCTHNKATTNCAIAYAIRDIFPHSITSCRSIYPLHQLGGDVEDIQISLPKEAQDFIRVFDKLAETPKQRKGIRPLDFEIEIPLSVIDHINIDDIYKSETLELVKA